MRFEKEKCSWNETLEHGTYYGEIDDLKYFFRKLLYFYAQHVKQIITTFWNVIFLNHGWKMWPNNFFNWFGCCQTLSRVAFDFLNFEYETTHVGTKAQANLETLKYYFGYTNINYVLFEILQFENYFTSLDETNLNIVLK